jgi:large subunit ribosomal protein L1
MAKKSKRMQDAYAQVDKEKVYEIAEAVELLKSLSSTKFDETVEIHFNLGIDPRKGDQQIRSTMVLPHGTGKSKSVIVFAEGEAAQAAEKAGADKVGSEELIAEIKAAGKCEFDEAVATPDMMRKLAPIAKILGTRGIMPSPKKETITPNVESVIKAIKGGKIAYRNDESANIHQAVGKVSFDSAQLVENIDTFVQALLKGRPVGQKGTFIKSATLTSSMGPGLKIDTPKR